MDVSPLCVLYYDVVRRRRGQDIASKLSGDFQKTFDEVNAPASCNEPWVSMDIHCNDAGSSQAMPQFSLLDAQAAISTCVPANIQMTHSYRHFCCDLCLICATCSRHIVSQGHMRGSTILTSQASFYRCLACADVYHFDCQRCAPIVVLSDSAPFGRELVQHGNVCMDCVQNIIRPRCLYCSSSISLLPQESLLTEDLLQTDIPTLENLTSWIGATQSLLIFILSSQNFCCWRCLQKFDNDFSVCVHCKGPCQRTRSVSEMKEVVSFYRVVQTLVVPHIL